MKIFITILFSFLWSINVPKTADITVIITDITMIHGKINIALYNKSNDFLQQEKRFEGVILEVNSNEIKYTFKNIPLGEYAIAIYHDENSDGKLTKNFIGLPAEGTAFSNNIRPHFGPPKYDDAKFNLEFDMSVRMRLVY